MGKQPGLDVPSDMPSWVSKLRNAAAHRMGLSPIGQASLGLACAEDAIHFVLCVYQQRLRGQCAIAIVPRQDDVV